MRGLIERVERAMCEAAGYDYAPTLLGDQPRAAIAEVFDYLEEPLSSAVLNAGVMHSASDEYGMPTIGDGDAYAVFKAMLAVLRREAMGE